MSLHAVFSPSRMKKILACPGSVAMEDGLPNGGNEYSDEGTAAHALAAMALTENSHPSAYIGRVLHVIDGVYSEAPAKVGAQSNRQFEVDGDFAGNVNVYVQKLREYANGHTLQVEQAVPIGHITGEEGATGTADGIVITADFTELQVHDLKFGQGVKVYAKENPQGLMYLLGALEMNKRVFEALGEMPSRFRFVIHQPRLKHLDEWDCTYDELMVFAKKVRDGVALARIATEHKVNWIKDPAPSGYLSPGDHCKESFCKARATCPALARFVEEAIGADFEVLAEMGKGPVTGGKGGVHVLGNSIIPDDLVELGKKFAVRDIVADWVKQVTARAEAVLFESNNDPEVQKVLRVKLVEGKKGSRAWASVEAVVALLKKMRLKTEEIYDLSVKSPAALEKQLKDEPKRWAKLTAMITQSKGKPSVAPLDDSRPALVMKPVADDFTDTTDGSHLV